MTVVQLRAAPADAAIAWWRVRERAAGPAGAVPLRLSGAVSVRLDRTAPSVLLDLEAIGVPGAQTSAVRALVAALWGTDAADALGTVTSVEFQGEHGTLRPLLLELFALAALVEGRFPALCSMDVARHAETVADRCPDPELQQLIRTFGLQHAARAARAWDRLPSYDDLGIDDSQRALLADVGRWIDARMGGTRGKDAVVPVVRTSPGPSAATLDASVRTDRVGALRGRARRAKPVTLADEHLGFVVADCAIEQRRDMVMLTGRWQAADGTTDAPPVAWARAFTPAGALVYAARCEFTDDSFTATLIAAGELDEDFHLDLTADLLADPWSGNGGSMARARMLAVAAANLQTTAADEEEWSVAAALWERSAAIWGASGDQARRTLSLVQALRAYRSAGPRYAGRVESLEHVAVLALTRLDPRWAPPDPSAAAVSADHPGQLGRLLTTASLAAPIERWVHQQLEAITAEVRAPGSGDADHRHLAGRIDELERAVATNRGGPARMNARVALAHWAASTGRRRMALLVLFPLVIRYDELDATGRREFAATQALLIGPVTRPDPDNPT